MMPSGAKAIPAGRHSGARHDESYVGMAIGETDSSDDMGKSLKPHGVAGHSAETKLLAQCFVKNQSSFRNVTGPPQNTSMARFDRIIILLEAGADPNVIICGYLIEGRLVHRLAGYHDNDDFIEGSYYDIYEGQNLSFNLEHYLHYKCSPIVEAIAAQDSELALLLVKFGARISKLADKDGRSVRREDGGPEWESVRETVLQREHLLRLVLSPNLHPSISLMDWVLPFLAETLLLQVEVNEVPHEGLLSDEQKVALWDQQWRHSLVPLGIVKRAREAGNLLSALSRGEGDLLTASILEDQRLCEVALASGSEVSDTDEFGITALHISTGNSTSNVCRYLLEQGADPNAKDDLGVTPLAEAVYFGNRDAVGILLDAGALINARIGHLMPRETSRVQVVSQPQSGLEGDWRARRDLAFVQFEELGWSILHIAVWYGDSEILDLLIENGADVNCQDRKAWTAFDLAVLYRTHRLAIRLLWTGSNFNPKGFWASRLLDYAISTRRYTAAFELEKRGVARYSDPESGEILSEAENEENHSQIMRLNAPWRSFHMGEWWNFRRRLQRTTCHHQVKLKRSSCQFCLLIKDRIAAERLPFGPVLMLALFDNVETQNDELLVRIDSVPAKKAWSARDTLRSISQWHGALEAISALDDAGSDSPAAVAMAKRWLACCNESHGPCQHVRRDYTPTRLLEILDDKCLRLVELKSKTVRYVALSHRWGTHGLPTTTTINLGERLLGISLKSLTPTMQDAVYVVTNLGMRYIWIDALCIVQDWADDWIREASEMGHVFSNAYLTLAAATSQYYNRGIFQARTRTCIRPFPASQLEHYVESTIYGLRDRLDDEQELYIFPNSEGNTGVRPEGVLDSRGWILQEQLLSPRILYYQDDELFWDCVTVSASESSPIQASLLEDENPHESWAFKLLRRALAGHESVEILRRQFSDIWMQVIMNYSRRRLTKPDDKFFALQGIIRVIERVLSESSVAGTWQCGLWKQLLWWTEYPEETQDEVSTENYFLAPSWSWLSIKGSVLNHTYMQVDSRLDDLCEVTTFKGAITGYQASQTHIEGILLLTGPSFNYCCTQYDLRELGFKLGHPKLKVAPAKWMLDREVQLPLEMQCVAIAADEVAKVTVCLCLVPDRIQNERWRRIGVCLWNGMTWQIATHCEQDLENGHYEVI